LPLLDLTVIVGSPHGEASMTTSLRMLMGVMLGGLLPAFATAQSVTYDYRQGQDFSRLRTYSFKDVPKSDNPFVDARITAAIAAQLAARGLTRDDVDPDVYVNVRQTFDTQPRYTIYGSPWGYGYGWGYPGFYGYDWNPWYTTVEVKDITVGTLTVDLEDAASDQVVWRGISVKRVHEMSKPSHVEKRINRRVSKMFEKYPPTAKGTVVAIRGGGPW
jgi:hypothetical protein